MDLRFFHKSDGILILAIFTFSAISAGFLAPGIVAATTGCRRPNCRAAAFRGILKSLQISLIDFAFSIHSEIGFKCKGAEINGKIATLNTRLRNGDKVKIITSENHVPNHAWLKIVQTTKAKTHIKRFLNRKKNKQQNNIDNNTENNK